MDVREVKGTEKTGRLWTLAVAAYQHARNIRRARYLTPLFVAER
jgi:hypothetical protein